MWTENADGKFTTKGAWSCLRIHAPEVTWSKWVWNYSLPKKVSVIVWKVFLNALSVDDNVCKIGIPLVSKCNCYVLGEYEDLNHVLAKGEFAELIWDKVFLLCGFTTNAREGMAG